jgi:hypothetical protein
MKILAMNYKHFQFMKMADYMIKWVEYLDRMESTYKNSKQALQVQTKGRRDLG